MLCCKLKRFDVDPSAQSGHIAMNSEAPVPHAANGVLTVKSKTRIVAVERSLLQSLAGGAAVERHGVAALINIHEGESTREWARTAKLCKLGASR